MEVFRRAITHARSLSRDEQFVKHHIQVAAVRVSSVQLAHCSPRRSIRRIADIDIAAPRAPPATAISPRGPLGHAHAPPPAFRGTSTPCSVDAEHEFLRRKENEQ